MIDEAIENGGMECPYCKTWRRVSENGQIEECLFCQDDERNLYDIEFWDLNNDTKLMKFEITPEDRKILEKHFVYEFSGLQLLAIVRSLQLALNHPKLKKLETAAMVEGIAREFQKQLSVTQGIAKIIELGWNERANLPLNIDNDITGI